MWKLERKREKYRQIETEKGKCVRVRVAKIKKQRVCVERRNKYPHWISNIEVRTSDPFPEAEAASF